jgi:DNA-binding Lrp family transcriptional regulator
MDRTDRQIVHCLQRHGRAPFSLIAQVIDVSEQTVARRYRSLYQSGALRVLVLPNAGTQGTDNWFVRIQCRPGSADLLADALAQRTDVAYVSVTSGGGEIVCATRRDRAAATETVLLQRLPRTNQVLSFTACSVLRMYTGGDAEWGAFDDPLSATQLEQLMRDVTPRQPRPSGNQLRPEDAPLLRELARDGRASVQALARACDWPASRVSSRLAQLLENGAIDVDIDLAIDQFGFHGSAYLWLTVPPGQLEAAGEELSRHPETAFVAAVTGSANLMAAVVCRDADALYTFVTTKVGALPSVGQTEIVPTLSRVKQAGTRIRNGRLELPVRT